MRKSARPRRHQVDGDRWRATRRIAVLGTSLTLVLGVGAAHASAEVLTVDDDGVQCPSADYATLQDAVAFAAQGDTIRICDGTYGVSGPAGLKIEKNVSLIGAGADKVTIQPDGTTPTLAGPTPNPRSEFGNVITVSRRLIELAKVEISGLTVRGNGVAVEGGIALVNVNESVLRDVRVTGLVPADGPGTGDYAPGGTLDGLGNGVVLANTIDGTVNAATLRGVSVDGFNKAGILVDSRLLSGVAPAGGTMTADLQGVRVTGAGTSPVVAQDGIEVWGSGASLRLGRSALTGVAGPSATAGAGAALYFRGANAATTLVGGAAGPNAISGNTFGAWAGTFDGSTFATPAIDARQNYWGSSNGPSLLPTKSAGDFVGHSAPSYGAGITWAPFTGTAPAAVVAPGTTPDAAPAVRFDTLRDGAVFPLGTTVPLDVVATDDFGIRQVEFLVDGEPVGVAGTFPYELDWTPTVGDGRVYAVSAVATDSAGQTTTTTASVRIGEPPVEPEPETPPTDSGPPTTTDPAPPTTTGPTPPTETTPAPPPGPAACAAVTTRITPPAVRPRIPSRTSLRGLRIRRGVQVRVRPSAAATVRASARVTYRFGGRTWTRTLRSASATTTGAATRTLSLLVPDGLEQRLPAGRALRVTLTVRTTPTGCAGPRTRSTTTRFRTQVARLGLPRG